MATGTGSTHARRTSPILPLTHPICLCFIQSFNLAEATPPASITHSNFYPSQAAAPSTRCLCLSLPPIARKNLSPQKFGPFTSITSASTNLGMDLRLSPLAMAESWPLASTEMDYAPLGTKSQRMASSSWAQRLESATFRRNQLLKKVVWPQGK